MTKKKKKSILNFILDNRESRFLTKWLFPSEIGNEAGMTNLSTLTHRNSGSSSQCKGQEKEMESMPFGKEAIKLSLLPSHVI